MTSEELLNLLYQNVKATVRPRVLVLAPRFPYPVIGGDRLRIYEICKALSKECDVTLLSICDTKSEMSMPAPNDGVFASIHRVFQPRWRSYFNCAVAVLTDTPLQVAYYRSRQFGNILRMLAPDHDVVLSHLLRTAEYAKDLGLPTVVEMTDAISMNYARLRELKQSNGLKSLIYAMECDRLNCYERKAVNEHDMLTFVSAIDARYLYGTNLPSKVLVCNNGVDTERLYFQLRSREARIIAFIGNMVSLQNQDAALWFALEILPLLRKHGNFRFRVVGQIPDKVREKFRGLEGVELTGRVASIPDAVVDCFAGVCSVRIGAGVQNKLLEYMSLGLPAVTTSIGLEGLSARDGEDLFVADTPIAFCSRLVQLWENKEQAERMAREARTYVESYHSWTAMLRPLTQRVLELSSLKKLKVYTTDTQLGGDTLNSIV